MGFCFLKQANEYKPPDSLVNWLKAGPAPIYIGFGSLVSLSFFLRSEHIGSTVLGLILYEVENTLLTPLL